MATKKQPTRNNNKQLKKYGTKPPAPPKRAQTKEELEREEQEFREKYGKGGLLRNILRIWRDSSPRGFITFFPVILLHLIFSFMWFCSSILTFFEGSSATGMAMMSAIYDINKMLVAFGMPLLLSFLHLRYNLRYRRPFFFNALIYIIPACALYAALDFVSNVLAFVFAGDLANMLKESAGMSLLVLGAAALVSLILGAVCQIALTYVRNKKTKRKTDLGLVLPGNDDGWDKKRK